MYEHEKRTKLDRGLAMQIGRMVKELEWIEMAQLAVSSILVKSFSLKLP